MRGHDPDCELTTEEHQARYERECQRVAHLWADMLKAWQAETTSGGKTPAEVHFELHEGMVSSGADVDELACMLATLLEVQGRNMTIDEVEVRITDEADGPRSTVYVNGVRCDCGCNEDLDPVPGLL